MIEREEVMIPKVIHYCWFGYNPYPEIVTKCIESWRKMCPDYEIKCWNEDNFDYKSCEYAREAYDAKKWAFVSDYARLKILAEYGGIYVDTDVELLKSLNDLLENHAFMGFEHGLGINSGLIAGAEKNQQIICELKKQYEKMNFINQDGSLNMTSCVEYTTNFLMKKGLKRKNVKQIIEGVTIFPTEYFCPKNQFTEKVDIAENTYSIHRYLGTWANDTVKYGQLLKRNLRKKYGIFIGTIFYSIKYSVYVVSKEGVRVLGSKVLRKVKIKLHFMFNEV